MFLYIVHHLIFPKKKKKKQVFQKLYLYQSSGKIMGAPTLLGPLDWVNLSHWTRGSSVGGSTIFFWFQSWILMKGVKVDKLIYCKDPTVKEDNYPSDMRCTLWRTLAVLSLSVLTVSLASWTPRLNQQDMFSWDLSNLQFKHVLRTLFFPPGFCNLTWNFSMTVSVPKPLNRLWQNLVWVAWLHF